MGYENTFIILFCVATAVAIAARRYRAPYTVALVVVGLSLGALGVLQPPHLTKDLLFAVFLPGLLFEAAFHLDSTIVRENLRTILSLAVPGVVAAIGLTAVLTTSVVQGLALDRSFTITIGLVFGAVVAATDPIAVTALFRSLRVPRRLLVLLEGESLLNDGTAVVFFTLILAYVAGESVTAGALVVSFFKVTIGGALLGVVIGAAASQVTQRVDEPAIEITLTVIAAYGTFVLAEQYHLSGVIGTVSAGLVCASYGRRFGMSPTTRLSVESFWEYVAFALNSIVFLLIGFEVSFGALAGYWREILAAAAAVVLARFGVVFLVTALLRRTSEGLPTAWASVLAWGGVRGALSVVLALSLPASLPHREQIITMTVGVVLASILVQGLTMAPLLRRLGIVKADAESRAYDRARADLRTASLALQEVDRMQDRGTISARDAKRLAEPYRTRADAARARIDALESAEVDLSKTRRLQAVRHLLALELDTAAEDLRHDVILPQTHDDLSREIAGRLVRLEGGEFQEPSDCLAPKPEKPEKPPKAEKPEAPPPPSALPAGH